MESVEGDVGSLDVNAVFSREPVEKTVWTGLKRTSDNTDVLCFLQCRNVFLVVVVVVVVMVEVVVLSECQSMAWQAHSIHWPGQPTHWLRRRRRPTTSTTSRHIVAVTETPCRQSRRRGTRVYAFTLWWCLFIMAALH